MHQPSERTMDEIRTLVAFDTTSRDSNLELIAHVEAHLEALGVASTRIPNPEGTKANLLATIPAADGSTTGGIVLSAHTDVVPVDGDCQPTQEALDLAWFTPAEAVSARVRDQMTGGHDRLIRLALAHVGVLP